MPPPLNLTGRRAVVTGAAAGIGRATAVALARTGMTIAAIDQDAAGLVSLTEEIEVWGPHDGPRVVDLSRPDEVEGLIDRTEAENGAIDLLVNVAGTGLQASVLQATPEDLRRLFEVNFFAAAALCRQALGVMAARRQGHIINVSSASARRGLPGLGAYAASKAALHTFTQALRQEARRHGVAVSEVLPTSVRTRFFDAATNRASRAYAAAGRLLTPEDVAQRILACARRPIPELHTTPILRLAFALEALAPNLVEHLVTWYYREAPAE